MIFQVSVECACLISEFVYCPRNHGFHFLWSSINNKMKEAAISSFEEYASPLLISILSGNKFPDTTTFMPQNLNNFIKTLLWKQITINYLCFTMHLAKEKKIKRWHNYVVQRPFSLKRLLFFSKLFRFDLPTQLKSLFHSQPDQAHKHVGSCIFS